MVRLNRTYYSLLNFTSKIFQNWVFWAKFKQIKQNPLNSTIYTPRITQNSHQLLTYLHYVSEACPGRERSGIPVNYANSAKFAHTVCEFREIRTFC